VEEQEGEDIIKESPKGVENLENLRSQDTQKDVKI
jgi:hypothetical protein